MITEIRLKPIKFEPGLGIRQQAPSFKGFSMSADSFVSSIFKTPTTKFYESQLSNLYQKIQRQLNLTSTKDLEQSVSKIIATTPEADESRVIAIMQKITQFANYKSLFCLQKLQPLGIGGFYDTEKALSLNNALNYLKKRKNIDFGSSGDKKAFILDDFGLNYLENLKNEDFEGFNALINNPDVKFVILDGWNSGINIYNANANIEDAVKNIFNKVKKLQLTIPSLSFEESVDSAINQDAVKQAKSLGITPIIINNSFVKDKSPSIKQVLLQLEPLNISKEKLNLTLESIAKALYEKEPAKIEKAKYLLSEYFNIESDVYSPKSMADKLKNIYLIISDELKKSGKSLKDVYYIIPEKNKSFDQVSFQYAKVNGIKQDKFIYYDKFTPPSLDIPENATIVLLDDVIDSATSIIYNKFNYERFIKNPENAKRNVFFAPIVCSKQGADLIYTEINKNKRAGLDKLLIKQEQIKIPFKETAFYNKLSSEDKKITDNILGDDGFGSALSIVFPYMGPDNNSEISYILNKNFVLTPKSLRTNKDIPPDILKKISASMMSN